MNLPKDLAGYQLICDEGVKSYDLAIPSWTMGPDDWGWVKDCMSLLAVTDSFGYVHGYRIYRKMPCPSHLDDKLLAGVSASPLEESDHPKKAKTYDEGKAPLAYLPWDGLREVAMVQEYGHKKYGDFYNYRKGMEVGRNLSCAMRHIVDYMDGKDLDDESKRSHLAHAACRVLFVLQNIHDGVAIDDRYKGVK